MKLNKLIHPIILILTPIFTSFTSVDIDVRVVETRHLDTVSRSFDISLSVER